MQWISAQAEHIGGRNEQQDRCLVLAEPQQQRLLAVLADGMGGHSGGALAAQAVIDTAQQSWQGEHLENPYTFLQNFCQHAHQNIQAVGAKHHIEPHSTCVALYLEQQQAHFTHLGDSRIYHMRKGRVEQRTRDHSLVQILVDLGRISEADMATHQDQGCLLKGLGGHEPLETIECLSTQAVIGDLFILCSDGFWEQIHVEEVWQQIATLPAYNAAQLKQLAQQLVKQAARRGGAGGDNISLILCLLK